MLIPIDENWRITSDAYNVIVEERKVRKKDGAERWEPVAYFATIQQAALWLLRRPFHSQAIQTIEEVRKVATQTAESLIAALDAAIEGKSARL